MCECVCVCECVGVCVECGLWTQKRRARFASAGDSHTKSVPSEAVNHAEAGSMSSYKVVFKGTPQQRTAIPALAYGCTSRVSRVHDRGRMLVGVGERGEVVSGTHGKQGPLG